MVESRKGAAYSREETARLKRWNVSREEAIERDELPPSYPLIAEDFPGRNANSIRGAIFRLRDKIANPDPEAEREPIGDLELFQFLKDKPRSLRQICNKFDRSPETMVERLDELEGGGLCVRRSGELVSISTSIRPAMPAPARTLADEAGMVVAIGIASDKHAGGSKSQPSALKRFIEIAGNEYGVRHFIDPGDLTAGIYGYRGFEEDLIPQARPIPKKGYLATQAQVEIAKIYTPEVDGAEWFILGGNHDWWHVTKTGFDPVRMFCGMREDSHYMGYDASGLWITDKFYIRLWHPTGGVPYAKSYRLQKGVETLAIEALKMAIKKEETPVTSLLIAGHLHISIHLPELPIPALHPGCFEGKTNYLKRKGYEPAVGGVILRMLVTDSGRVQRMEHTWIAFDEIKDDWKNFPVPDVPEVEYSKEELDVLYEGFEPLDPEERFPIEDPRASQEYGGGAK